MKTSSVRMESQSILNMAVVAPSVIGALWMLTTGIVVLGSWQPPPTKVLFNNRMASANVELKKKAEPFRKAIFPELSPNKAFDPDKVDLPALRTALDGMNQTLSDIRSRNTDATLPNRSSSAPGLRTAYGEYLDEQQKIVDKAGKIKDTLEDGKLSKVEKYSRVTEMLDDIRKIEEAALEKMTAAQKIYAEQHHFKPVANLN